MMPLLMPFALTTSRLFQTMLKNIFGQNGQKYITYTTCISTISYIISYNIRSICLCHANVYVYIIFRGDGGGDDENNPQGVMRELRSISNVAFGTGGLDGELSAPHTSFLYFASTPRFRSEWHCAQTATAEHRASEYYVCT